MASIENLPIINLDQSKNLTQASTTTGQATTNAQIPANPNSGTLQIQTTSILPTQVPELKAGDIIQFLVKDIKPNNVGILYFFGQLIEAKLPSQIKSGDVVKAEVQRENLSVILKIKEILSNSHSQSNSNPTIILETSSTLSDLLSNKVEFLLKSLESVLTQNSSHTDNVSEATFLTQLPEEANLPQLKDLNLLLGRLKNILPSNSGLEEPRKIQDFLKNISNGSYTEKLSILLDSLTENVNTTSHTHEEKFAFELLKKITTLPLEDSSDPTLQKEIKKLLTVLTQEQDNITLNLAPNNNKIQFKNILQTVKETLSKLELLPTKEEKQTALNQLINSVQLKILGKDTNDFEAQEKILDQTRNLLHGLESAVKSQEMINKLEPILASLKEPQLLLFPFLMGGMFGFAELIVDPDANKKHGDKNSKQQKDKSVYAYQGVIPLPNLGQVQFNAIQSKSEINLQFNLENDEKKNFLEKELADLRDSLLKEGINTKEITLNVSTFTKLRVSGLDIDDPLVVI